MSLSAFLDEVRDPPSKDEEDTNVDYFALVQQPNTSMRDTFYAEKSGFLSRPHEEREREALREQDISTKRTDVVNRLDAAVRSGVLSPSDRERFMTDNFARLAREYSEGIIDKERFTKDTNRELRNFMQINSKKLPLFDFARRDRKGDEKARRMDDMRRM